MGVMDFEFEGPVVEWRGPAPFYFLRVPEHDSDDIKIAVKDGFDLVELDGFTPDRLGVVEQEQRLCRGSRERAADPAKRQ